MNLREEKGNKPLTFQVFHYFDDARQGQTLVGSVWQTDEGGEWSAHCTCDVKEGLYGHLGDFDSKDDALDCLKRRLGGDKTAKGRQGD